MRNGEPTWAAIEGPFGLIMSRAEAALRELAQKEPCTNGDGVVQFKLTAKPRVLLGNLSGHSLTQKGPQRSDIDLSR